MPTPSPWPSLDYASWSDTATTLHLWTQIVGKIRLVLTPWTNHAWHVPLYVTPTGLTTSTLYHPSGPFDLEFDTQRHVLAIRTASGEQRTVALRPRTVASFYSELMGHLDDLGLSVSIDEMPNELPDPIRFSEDTVHQAYDPEAAARFVVVLNQSVRVFAAFRARFLGKCSPVHFFWGSFDLAVTRFSGRPAPPHPGGIPFLPDWVTREAYSHEVYSCGFWPGGPSSPHPAFYAYAYPVPDGLSTASVQPPEAFWSDDMGEFFLPYDAVLGASDPDETLMVFLESTYGAVADLAQWDRAALDTPSGFPHTR